MPVISRDAIVGSLQARSTASTRPKASMASYALNRIRSDILAVRLLPGQKLTFEKLSNAYEISLSPLREALCQLAGSGLVTLESQKGFRVASVSRADLLDVIDVRRMIEGKAVTMSASNGDDAWRSRVLDELKQFALVAAKVGDQRPIDEHWQSIHRSFHYSLIAACGSSYLVQMWSQVYDRFDRYRKISIPVQAVMAATATDHREIAHAAISGNVENAQQLLLSHIDEIASIILERFDPLAEKFESIR